MSDLSGSFKNDTHINLKDKSILDFLEGKTTIEQGKTSVSFNNSERISIYRIKNGELELVELSLSYLFDTIVNIPEKQS